MARYRFSKLATSDLLGIAMFTQNEWGEAQAKKYVRQLNDCCALLANNSGIGRSATFGRWSGQRMEQGSHVVFYRPDKKGIFVHRIIHKNMLPERQRF